MPSGLSKSGNKSSKILLDIESRHNSTNKATVKTTKSTKAPKLMTPASPIIADDEYAEDEFEQTPA